ncbi:MAG TPA: hypothetical protein VFX96_15120, partial [Pyrinomonadaceae bacterium]|nr:hypothetical protein [Pyrinomonadaceae bacterium]
MKNTSLPRLLTSAALSAAFLVTPAVAQVASQSYLRQTPNEIEREDPRIQNIIARSESHFKQGELNLADGKRVQARDEFDKAVDVILESGLNVRGLPRLEQYYLQLVERIYRIEVPLQQMQEQRQQVASVVTAETPDGGGEETQVAQTVQVGFVEQKFEPSPLDEFSKLVLTEKEREVSPDQVAQLEEEIQSTLDFKFKP